MRLIEALGHRNSHIREIRVVRPSRFSPEIPLIRHLSKTIGESPSPVKRLAIAGLAAGGTITVAAALNLLS